MVRENSYITIQAFMINELELKGNELLVYAIIYGFTQNGENTFNSTLQYLCEWTNSTKQGVLKNIKSLIDKGLIDKIEYLNNGVKYVEYYTTYGGSTKFNSGKQSLMGYSTKFNGVVNKVDPIIKEYNKIYNKDIKENNNNIIIKEKQKPYGVYGRVKLTDKEYEKLVNDYGESTIKEMITRVDEYVESNNNKNKYTNYNLVIRKAIRENWFTSKRTNSNDKVKKSNEYSNSYMNNLNKEMESL